MTGPGGDAYSVRLDAGILPDTYLPSEGGKLVLAAGRALHRGAAAVHGGAIANQAVDLTVQPGDRGGPEQRHRPGQDLRSRPVVHRQTSAASPHADAEAGQ